ncbi:MAG: DUF3658 domain-containing protein [Acidobacteriota bacterium]
MTDPEIIAEKAIYAIDNNGRGFDIGLQIGRPFKTEMPHGDWACPSALIGLHSRIRNMFGVDPLQALSIALKLTRSLLEVFVEDGGQLFSEPGGEPITVDEVFGVAAERPVPDGPLTPEQSVQASALTQVELDSIDAMILRNCSLQFRKIARVVGGAMFEVGDSFPKLPDVFYADRVRELVAKGKLESHGDITAMRFGEVKLV